MRNGFRGFVLAAICALVACSSGGPVMPASNGASIPAAIEAERSIWSVVSSPNEPPGSGGYDDTLWAVSGASASDVWAVGNYCCYVVGSKLYYEPLIEHWNGSVWSIVPGASDAPNGTMLRGVAAISGNDVWVVGGAVQAVFEHWNGTQWSIVSSPYFDYGAQMNAIVAVSKNNVWAAGEGDYAAVLEHWDGNTWTYVPAYTYGGLTILNAISASGANDIWAVGEYWSYPDQHSFAEHWNGAAWSYEQPVSSWIDQLNGVVAISPASAWAVGYADASDQNQVPQTLIEHWNGSQWSRVQSPNKDPKAYDLDNELYSVTARSPNDIWAVGYWTWLTGDGTSRSLFVHWNGKAWKTEPGPPALESSNNAAFNQLLGIVKLRTGQLWAVGSQAVPHQCCAHTLTVTTAGN